MGAEPENPALSSNPMHRAKVYRLNDSGKWDDRGTGHVSLDHIQGSEIPALFVFDEDDHETILEHRISSNDIYRREEEKIISWLDPVIHTDLSLSFQESSSCSFIWDQIYAAQEKSVIKEDSVTLERIIQEVVLEEEIGLMNRNYSA